MPKLFWLHSHSLLRWPDDVRDVGENIAAHTQSLYDAPMDVMLLQNDLPSFTVMKRSNSLACRLATCDVGHCMPVAPINNVVVTLHLHSYLKYQEETRCLRYQAQYACNLVAARPH
jgi:hypothetical protein